MAALAGEYHSVVARAAAARADALGLPFLCSSAFLDALTEEPTEWVARLAPAQSHGWRIYADFLLGAGHRRIAVATEPIVYWASGARILRDYLSPRGGTVIEVDVRALAPAAVCDELVSNRAAALLLLVGFPEPAGCDCLDPQGFDVVPNSPSGRAPCRDDHRAIRNRMYPDGSPFRTGPLQTAADAERSPTILSRTSCLTLLRPKRRTYRLSYSSLAERPGGFTRHG